MRRRARGSRLRPHGRRTSYVHALQDQYIPLDSILQDKSSNGPAPPPRRSSRGRRTSRPSSCCRAPRRRRSRLLGNFRRQGNQDALPFRRGWLPAVLLEGLLFPYVPARVHALVGTVTPPRHAALRPAHAALHRADHAPRAVRARGPPVNVRSPTPCPAAMRMCSASSTFACSCRSSPAGRRATPSLPLGWGGDRFRLDEGNGGPALVWISLWDELAPPRLVPLCYGRRSSARARSPATGHRSIRMTAAVAPVSLCHRQGRVERVAGLPGAGCRRQRGAETDRPRPHRSLTSIMASGERRSGGLLERHRWRALSLM